MHFEYSFEIALPRDVVYKTLRDDLVHLTNYLPNIKSIKLIKKELTDDGIKVLNKWQGNNLAQLLEGKIAHIADMAWLDRAEWHDKEHTCNWSYTPFILEEYINAHGIYIFLSYGKHTIIKISGDLKIDIASYPLVSSELKGTINDELFQNFFRLIKINFETIVNGLEDYIKENDSTYKQTKC